ncbi:hypothetical protein D915_003235 [Fasciola hepatica]|uniref:Uncharacterized protein n=1 Tax=Fasciola hepatica TaxID=6192 RepID=A0A4E0RBT9_FASHE|nr:hypothetical protein D915_003235 [Fasciola hepatica]
MFLALIGIQYLGLCIGLPWHSLHGYCTHTYNFWSCRATQFISTWVISFMTNVFCMEAMNQALYLKFSGQIPPTASVGLVFVLFVLAMAFALPDLYVNGLFLVEGQLYCGTSATYPKSIIMISEIHRALFGHGRRLRTASNAMDAVPMRPNTVVNVNPDPFALDDRLAQLLLFTRKFDRAIYKNMATLRDPIIQLAHFRYALSKYRDHLESLARQDEAAKQGLSVEQRRKPIEVSDSSLGDTAS